MNRWGRVHVEEKCARGRLIRDPLGLLSARTGCGRTGSRRLKRAAVVRAEKGVQGNRSLF